MDRRMQFRFGVGIVLALVVIITTGASLGVAAALTSRDETQMGTPETTDETRGTSGPPSVEALCQLADTLNAASLPQQARAVIEGLKDAATGVDACDQALERSLERIGNASALATAAQQQLESGQVLLNEPDRFLCTSGAEREQDSEKLDQDSSVPTLLQESLACDSENEQALALQVRDPVDVCSQAAELNQLALPQQAKALLQSLGDDQPADCRDQQASADVRIARATLFASRAQALLRESAVATTETPMAAPEEEDADPAARCGTPNDGGVDELVRAALECDAENAAALGLASGPQRVNERWQGFTDTVLTPTNSRLLRALAMVTTLVVLARLITRWLPANGLRLPGNHSHPGMAIGAALIFLAAALASGASDPTPDAMATVWNEQLRFAGAVVLGSTGVFLLAWAWSRRFRVSVAVVDDKGAELHGASGHLAALLLELGGGTPRGIELPRGSDVTALDAAGLSPMPEGRVAASLFKVFELLLLSSPWKVRVEWASEDVHTVSVVRNGRTLATQLIDRDRLRLRISVDEPKADANAGDRKTEHVDLMRMSAAVALVKMQEEYGFSGLNGANDWRSIGFHDIATVELRERKEPAIDLLARAVEISPSNEAARVALWHRRYRESTKVAELDDYIRRLDEFVGRTKGLPEEHVSPELRLRVLYTRAALTINRAYARGMTLYGAKRSLERDTKRYEELKREHGSQWKRGGTSARFAARMAKPVRLLGWCHGIDTPTDDWRKVIHSDDASTAHRAYQAACYYGSRPDIYVPGSSNLDAAIRLLEVADADPALKAWRAKDPQLKAMRTRRGYRRRFGRAPITRILDLPTYKPHAQRLQALGASAPRLIATQPPDELADKLEVTTATAARLVGIAALVDNTNWPPRITEEWKCELAVALWDHGVEYLPSPSLASDPDLASAIHNSLRDREEPYRVAPPVSRHWATP